MNNKKEKVDLSTELDQVISDIREESPENKDEKKPNKLWTIEAITMDDDQNFTIGTRSYRLVYNHREAFQAEKFAQRFSEVLYRYDYIVGDWGFEQLRLKGFYSASHKKVQPELRIDTLEDYLYELSDYLYDDGGEPA